MPGRLPVRAAAKGGGFPLGQVTTGRPKPSPRPRRWRGGGRGLQPPVEAPLCLNRWLAFLRPPPLQSVVLLHKIAVHNPVFPALAAGADAAPQVMLDEQASGGGGGGAAEAAVFQEHGHGDLGVVGAVLRNTGFASGYGKQCIDHLFSGNHNIHGRSAQYVRQFLRAKCKPFFNGRTYKILAF